MAQSPRIVLIGAGSVVFTRDLLADILRFPALADSEIALHDIDEERLSTAEAIAHRVAEQVGAHPKVSTHSGRRDALAGAGYVINMVQIGGIDATRVDFDVPERFGLRQTIADTLGVGGIFRALRTFPLLDALARDIAEVCPEAWLFNYTNPMVMNMWYLSRVAPRVRALGLCHSVHWTVSGLCDLVGVPLAEVDHLAAGVNHQAWLLRWERAGQSLYPLLDERIAADPELRRRVRVDMYRRLGYYPTETSEHSAEYLPWYLRHRAEIDRLRIPVRDYVRISEENVAEYRSTRDAVRAGRPVPLSDTTEYAPQLIHSIETRTSRRIYATVPNTGLITNLPAGAAVEVPVVVDGLGAHPVHVGTLPPQCAGLNRAYLNVAELTVAAAVEGEPRYVRHAAMLDPNTAASLTVDAIWELCDALTVAHGDLLPEPLRERLTP
jgi:alpha-galactosidase